MRRIVLTAAFAALALAAPPAAATGNSTYTGGCGWGYVVEPTGTLAPPGHVAVDLDLRFALYSESTDVLVSATVTCTYRFRDEHAAELAVHTLAATGTGVVTADTTVTVPGIPSSWFSGTCVTVDYTSDDTPTDESCSDRISMPLIPPPIVDAVRYVVAQVPGARDTSCAAFTTAGPVGTSDVVVDGDLYVESERVTDC